VLLMRPPAAALADTLWPHGPARRLALLAFALPIVLPAFAAVATRSGVSPLWAISAMTLVPVVLLSSPLIAVPRIAAGRILGIAIMFPLLMVAASPVIAIVIHRNGVPGDATHYRPLAAAMAKAWRETTDRPLRLIGSNTNLVNGVVFYFPSRPLTYEMMAPAVTPWVDDTRIARDGIAIACRVGDTACNAAADRLAERFGPGSSRDVAVSRTYFGHTDPAVRYRIVIIPPKPQAQ
jgi:hypothetical protein